MTYSMTLLPRNSKYFSYCVPGSGRASSMTRDKLVVRFVRGGRPQSATLPPGMPGSHDAYQAKPKHGGNENESQQDNRRSAQGSIAGSQRRCARSSNNTPSGNRSPAEQWQLADIEYSAGPRS